MGNAKRQTFALPRDTHGIAKPKLWMQGVPMVMRRVVEVGFKATHLTENLSCSDNIRGFAIGNLNENIYWKLGF